MVGRYGGEEFLVIMNKCNPASVGLALSSDFTNSDVEELLHQADMPCRQRVKCVAIVSGLLTQTLPIK